MAIKGKVSKLAVDGGSKVRKGPWPVRKLFMEREKAAVMKLFDRAMTEGSHILGYNGEQEQNYCKEFARYMGGGYADGVNSGTSALYVALRSLEIEPFSEVIVPPTTDPGGVMPVPLINCIPVQADSAPGFYNAGAEQIAACLTRRTRAIIVAHITGFPVDMDPVMKLARARGIPVIEDCAQAHGGMYKGRMLGSIGDVAAFSTMFGKHHATAGQGGIVFTKNEAHYWRIRRFADRGKPFGLEGPHTNVVASLNFNMDELHAAIGRVQLKRLPGMLAIRRKIAARIGKGLMEKTRTVRLAAPPAHSKSAYWFLFMRIQPERLTISKSDFVKAVVAEGVPMGERYWCVPSTQEWFRNRAVYGKSGLPWTSERYKGSYGGSFDLTNVTAADACHVAVTGFHEGCTSREADDIVDAVSKVEKTCLR